MSKELEALKSELSRIYDEIDGLEKRALEIEDQIHMQRLIDWMAENKVNTAITEIPMNQEMHDYIVKNGFPGGYIEYELDKWAVGTPMIFRGKWDNEGSVCAGPLHNHSGLFPPDMILRAIKELLAR